MRFTLSTRAGKSNQDSKFLARMPFLSIEMAYQIIYSGVFCSALFSCKPLSIAYFIHLYKYAYRRKVLEVTFYKKNLGNLRIAPLEICRIHVQGMKILTETLNPHQWSLLKLKSAFFAVTFNHPWVFQSPGSINSLLNKSRLFKARLKTSCFQFT